MNTPVSKKHAPRGRIKARPANLLDATDLMDASSGKNYTTCTGTSKQAKRRCRRRPIPGGTVCVIHGGGAPQVQQAAEERLKALNAPAITRLEHWLMQNEFPSVSIAAVKDILDRNGALGKARETHQHAVTFSLEDLVAGSMKPPA